MHVLNDPSSAVKAPPRWRKPFAQLSALTLHRDMLSSKKNKRVASSTPKRSSLFSLRSAESSANSHGKGHYVDEDPSQQSTMSLVDFKHGHQRHGSGGSSKSRKVKDDHTIGLAVELPSPEHRNAAGKQQLASDSPGNARKPVISLPFDFYHVSHSQRGQIPNRMSKDDFATDFAVVKASQLLKMGELRGIQADDLFVDGYDTDEPRLNTRRQSTTPTKGKRKSPPLRPKRSDEKLTGAAARETGSAVGPRHVRSAENLGYGNASSLDVSSDIPPVPAIPHRRLPSLQNLPLSLTPTLGSAPLSSTPNLLSSGGRSQSPMTIWNNFSNVGFSSSLTDLYQSKPSASALPYPPLTLYADDPLLTPVYGQELGGIPEEPEESRSQRPSADTSRKDVQPTDAKFQEEVESALPNEAVTTSPTSSAPKPSFEALQQQSCTNNSSLKRTDSSASDTLGGERMRHRKLPSRGRFLASATPVLGLHPPPKYWKRRMAQAEGAASSFFRDEDWESDVDYCYDHHMEAHCDLDWNNSNRLEMASSDDENVAEPDHNVALVNNVADDMQPTPPRPSKTYTHVRRRYDHKSRGSLSSSDGESRDTRKHRVAARSPWPILIPDHTDDDAMRETPDLERTSAGTLSTVEARTPADNKRDVFEFPPRSESMFQPKVGLNEPYLSSESPSLLLFQEFADEQLRDQLYKEMLSFDARRSQPEFLPLLEFSPYNSYVESLEPSRTKTSHGVASRDQTADNSPLASLRSSFMLPQPSNPTLKRRSISLGGLDNFVLPTPPPETEAAITAPLTPTYTTAKGRSPSSRHDSLRVNAFVPQSTPTSFADTTSSVAANDSIKSTTCLVGGPPAPISKSGLCASAPPTQLSFNKPLPSPGLLSHSTHYPPSPSSLSFSSTRSRSPTAPLHIQPPTSNPTLHRKISSEGAALDTKALPPVPALPALRPRSSRRTLSASTNKPITAGRTSFSLFPPLQPPPPGIPMAAAAAADGSSLAHGRPAPRRLPSGGLRVAKT